MPTVAKRGDKYRAFIRLAGRPSESRSFTTRREAQTWAVEREKELRQRRLDAPDLLIDELFDRYVKEIAPKRKMARSHLAHDVPGVRRRLGRLSLADLHGNGITRWVMAQSDISPSSRNWNLSRLTGVLRQCEHYFDIRFPWSDIEHCRNRLKALGYISVAGQRDRRLSDSEIAAIKGCLQRQLSVHMADIIDFCVQSCMRIGEVTRLEWSDLDRNARTIIVKDRKHPTKKFGNHCVVPLLNGAYETLIRQPVRDDRIFPHHATNLSRNYKRAADKAGVKGSVLHDLRHEGISRMFELGFAIQEVALVSGHTNWRTLARYTHLRPESLVQREIELRAGRKTSDRQSGDQERPVARGANRTKAPVTLTMTGSL